MTPRKLLFATSSIFFPDSSGGAERSLLRLFDGLRRRGWEVEVVCGRSLRSPHAWKAAAAALLRLRAPRLFARDEAGGLRAWRGLRRFRGRPAWTAWFDGFLDAYRPDAVLGYNNLTCPLLGRALDRGLPCFFVVRSLANLFEASRFIPDGVHLLANSPFAASVAAAATGRPAEVVLPLVDAAGYRVEGRQRRYVTFVNPTPEKGVAVALAVARALPETRFLFVKGRWGDRSYETVARGLPNVEVWDHRHDMRAVYAVTDVLLVPSQWLETFGRVVVEAQQSGIPVVAADVGGLPFTVGEGGLLVRPKGDPAAYVEALRRLRADQALYAELSARALANSRRPEFDPEAQADAFVAIVERALAAGASPRPAGGLVPGRAAEERPRPPRDERLPGPARAAQR
jgi:glycosyltransferase involved in cell wall biosynthesis